MVRLYKEGLSAQQVADRVGISKQAVLARLRQIGVRRTPGRGRSPDNFRYPYPPYGFRVVSQRLVLNRRELRIARLIVELRDCNGMKWAEMVEVLKAKGARTRSKREWSSVGLRRVHKRWSGKL